MNAVYLFFLFALALADADAFSVSVLKSSRYSTTLRMSSHTSETTRKEFLGRAVSSIFLVNALVPETFAENDVSLPSGVAYTKTKIGEGAKPKLGEMAAIRFKANVEGTSNMIDDIFDSPEPYYTRIGSGGLLKGVEEVLPEMRVGDRWVITIPGNLAFGTKGRPASAGKPRIPGNAVIIFDVEMVGIPGRETELIELIGDE